ncbi:MAG: cysteine desulfurase [Parvibaculaceae bacterium]|nr:cysteine desulfurase [Parvibaculaceae bacterium]
MSRHVYLDYNATAPLCAQSRAAMEQAMEVGANASSVHTPGRTARGVIETAREAVGALVGTRPANIVFTSGGTEANNLALEQARALGCDRVLVGATEHPAIGDAAVRAGLAVTVLPCDREGLLDMPQLERELAKPGRAFVAVMHANNETGAIQPIESIAKAVRGVDGILLSDCVQSLGKLPIDLQSLGPHMITISAHKIGGPQGVGALAMAQDVPIAPVNKGGGQERGRRGGTENLIGIAGFGAAAQAALEQLNNGHSEVLLNTRNAFETRLQQSAPDLVIFSESVERLPNTSCFSAPGLRAEKLLMALDLAGFAVSAGSACSSGKVTRSHVLGAMGIEENLALGAIRVSTGWQTDADDVTKLADCWLAAYRRAQATNAAA